MITRLVKLTLDPEKLIEFQAMFEEVRDQIAGFDGCEHLRLYQEVDGSNVFFTYSIWRDETALETYRHSDLFKSVWARTKVGFAGKPEAWSVNSLFDSKS